MRGHITTTTKMNVEENDCKTHELMGTFISKSINPTLKRTKKDHGCFL